MADAEADVVVQLPTAKGHAREAELRAFAEQLESIDATTGFKVSARGWCYQLEQYRAINKDQFDVAEAIINELRRKGYLPVDFVAEEPSRQFSGVEKPDKESPEEYLAALLRGALSADAYYTPDWWSGEEYYVQMVVEKIDLRTLFEPVCKQYHIPIATTKGWSSILQRAEYARRFQEAEEKGLKCVLLVAGDHDPDGLRITDFIESNLRDVAQVRWEDGTQGYDPESLEVLRFGLNHDFIQANALTWIDNLITGSGANLADPRHKNHRLPYVQEYIRKYGVRKCEANALVVRPKQGQELCRAAIERFLGRDARDRFAERRAEVTAKLKKLDRKTGYVKTVRKVIEESDAEEDEEDDDGDDH